MIRRDSIIWMTVWCLLLLWGLYGGLELLEDLQVVVKVQAGPDLDLEALLQLASGIKSDVPSVDNQAEGQLGKVLISLCLKSFADVQVDADNSCHRAPSLRRHQFISVYRI